MLPPVSSSSLQVHASSSSDGEVPHSTIEVEVDLNQGFWAETKKREEALGLREEEDVVAAGNQGLMLCNAVVVVVSQALVASKDAKVR